MDAYLEIAEYVLKAARRPLSPRAIIEEAFKSDLVPPHLFGQTQHKTLQARLSEDILHEKERSRFFRTQPGRFFLREFLHDESIPEEFRHPIKARRRIRELTKGPVLHIKKSSIKKLNKAIRLQNYDIFGDLSKTGCLSYFDTSNRPKDFVNLWCFAIFCKDDDILSYRLGQYRENRDHFSVKRTIGFTSLVCETDQTFFNIETLGVIESALSALTIDLDIPIPSDGIDDRVVTLRRVVSIYHNDELDAALMVMDATCPSWFEPTKRRLSMNDLRWMPFGVPPNHLEDFDPWSQAVIQAWFTCDD